MIIRKISNLKITSEKMLEQKVTSKTIGTNKDVKVSLREYWFDERYKPFTDTFHYSSIIEFAHRIKFEVVDEKDSEYFNLKSKKKQLNNIF